MCFCCLVTTDLEVKTPHDHKVCGEEWEHIQFSDPESPSNVQHQSAHLREEVIPILSGRYSCAGTGSLEFLCLY